MAICDWPANQRPREKLITHGSESLSDAELLAIFLRTGIKGKSAVDMARELLCEFGGLRALMEASQEQFCAAKGLGSAKYALLQSVTEMARRHLTAELQAPINADSSDRVKAFVTSQLRHVDREVFAVLCLNSQYQLIHFEKLFFGTIDSASIHPREVLKLALQHNAKAVILTHNHPSGDTTPSDADRRMTRHLQQALALVDIDVLDHLIVGNGPVLSFAERGLL